MFYPDYQHEPFFDNIYISFDGRIYSVGDSSGNGGWCYEEKTKILMQFTGCKDKNCKEVYEGDIIKGLSEDMPLPEIREVRFYAGRVLPSVLWQGFIFEIIGNIYQNPELLN